MIRLGAHSGILILFLLFIFSVGCNDRSSHEWKFEKMLVEYAEHPDNLSMHHPRFSWIISSSGRNEHQTSYRILLASSVENLHHNNGDLWDSGTRESDETIQHNLVPDILKSDSKYFWKVIIRDGHNEIHESQISEFSTALLEDYMWKAKWIGSGSDNDIIPPEGFYSDPNQENKSRVKVNHDGRSLLLRKVAFIGKDIESAHAFITGLGYYEFYVNGSRVGDHVLSPAKTPYHKYVLYDTYDITSFVKTGKNAFGIHLGNGWYNPYKKWWDIYRMQWFGHKKAIAEIHLRFSDGTGEVIGTDESWSSAPGPVTFNCVYDGEIYDARLEKKGWNEPGCDTTSWKNVKVCDSYSPALVSSTMPAIRINVTFSPKRVKTADSATKVFDMGQNFAGWVRIEVSGKRNTRIKMRFAEDLKADSTLDVTSNEHAVATAEYILKGESKEIFEPRFTFFGFRFAELSIAEGAADISYIEGRSVYSSNTSSGNFECSNDLVNRIHRATIWSQKSNMIGYPMDCPQRDERLGWMGDAQVTAEEAMYNFDMSLFYKNWLEGIRENQDPVSGDIPIISPRPYIRDDGVEWSSTYILLLWQYFSFYGDKQMLEQHYPAMCRYVNFLDSISDNGIVPKGWIGDWGSMAEGWKEGDPPSVPTAYFYLDAKILSEIALLLGKIEDHNKFMKLSEFVRERYNQTFLNPLTSNFSDGSQMANSFPLWLGIVPEEKVQGVFNNLVEDIVLKQNYHLTTGVLGTKYMPEILAASERSDVVWKIINQKTPPSWYEMMKKYNTMCEFWTLKQSKNHVMMGSIDAWFYRHLAGIQNKAGIPAFASFIIKPYVPENLDHVNAQTNTLRGLISSSWDRKDNWFSLDVHVPFNTTADIFIPGKQDSEVMESGKPVGKSHYIIYMGYRDGCHVLRIGSGSYWFKLKRE